METQCFTYPIRVALFRILPLLYHLWWSLFLPVSLVSPLSSIVSFLQLSSPLVRVSLVQLLTAVLLLLDLLVSICPDRPHPHAGAGHETTLDRSPAPYVYTYIHVHVHIAVPLRHAYAVARRGAGYQGRTHANMLLFPGRGRGPG